MFYHHDLIGSVVDTVDGQRVGVVAAVEGDPGNSRLVIDADGKRSADSSGGRYLHHHRSGGEARDHCAAARIARRESSPVGRGMRIDVVTIFPAMVQQALGAGIVGRAIERGTLNVVVHDLRDYDGQASSGR